MRRDLFITALIFLVVGFVAGAVYTRQTTSGALRPAAAPAAASGSTLPVGHPPLDVAERWSTLQKQAEANPRDLRAQLELANFLYDTERWEEAITWYQRALELDPKNTDARTDLATGYYNLGRFDEAITHYTRALERERDKPQALYGLAMARLRGKNDAAGARRVYEQLRRTHPEFPGVATLAQLLNEGRLPR